MPNKTANYNLTKPLERDYYDINVSNENMDIIDREIKRVTEDSNKRIDHLEANLQDNELSSFKTDVLMTKLDNCNGGFVSLDKIEGRTLVNLSKFITVNKHKTDPLYYVDGVSNSKNRVVSVVNNSNKSIYIDIAIDGKWKRQINISATEIIKTINFTNEEYISAIVGAINNGWTEQNKDELKKVMILDEEAKTLPSGYFEGMKSVGEEIINADGTKSYKVEILSKTKNLLDIKNINKMDNATSNTVGVILNNCINIKNTTATNFAHVYFHVKNLTAGKKYTIKANKVVVRSGAGNISIRDKNDSSIGVDGRLENNYTCTFIVPLDGEVRLKFYSTLSISQVGDVDYLDVQLEEGDGATGYVEYKENKTEILLPQPLTGYDYLDNEGILHLSSYIEVFDGSESTWSIYSTLKNTFTVNLKNSQYSKAAICDKYQPITDPSKLGTTNGFYAFSYGGLIISDMSCSTVDDLKNKLKTNPITITYQQCDVKYNPIYRNINLNKTFNLKSCDYLNINSGAIQPQVTYSYAKTSGERITSIENRIGDLDIGVINKNINDVDIKIGEISNLQTNDKTSVVSSINELFQSASNSQKSVNDGKNLIAGVVGNVTGQSSFQEVANYIANKKNEIGGYLGAGDYPNLQRLCDCAVQRKIDISNQLILKGITANWQTENLSLLINKISSIYTGFKYATGTSYVRFPSKTTVEPRNTGKSVYADFVVNSLNFKPHTVIYNVYDKLSFDSKASSSTFRYTNGISKNKDLEEFLGHYLFIQGDDFMLVTDTSTNKYGEEWNKDNGFNFQIKYTNSKAHSGGECPVKWVALG